MGYDGTLGDRVGRLRARRGLTQERLAERADVSVDTVRKLEQNRRHSARLSTLNRLARALDVETSVLIDQPTTFEAHDEGDAPSVLALRQAVAPVSDRFAAYLLPGEADALTGAYLLHTDTNPHNFLIQDATGAACLIDWAMPALGPAWIDAAYTAVRLMECGHAPEEARAWLAGFSSWRDADPQSVDAFVNVTCRHWTAALGERDAEPSNTRFRSLLPA